jgi:hypothetical protein
MTYVYQVRNNLKIEIDARACSHLQTVVSAFKTSVCVCVSVCG